MQSSQTSKLTKRILFGLLAILVMALMALPVLADSQQESGVYGPMGCSMGECTQFGTAELDRKSDRIHVKVSSSGLDENAAYTLWFVVFNNPEFCSGMCDSGDVGDPNVVTSVLWGTGKVVSNDGEGQFNAVLREGSPPGEVISGPGLLDAEKAEIHVVLRTHGEPIPGLVTEQITTLAGGCDINGCTNQQFAIFP